MAREFLIKAKLDITPGNINAVINNITKQLQSKPINLSVLTNTSSVKAAATSVASVGTAAKTSTRSVNSLAESIGNSARRIASFALATATFLTFVRAIKTSLKNAIDFEKEMIKIAQGTDKTVDSLSTLNKEIGKLATGFGVSSKELVVAARTLAQAGISGDKLASILKTLSQTELAATFDTIIDTTEGVIAVLAQFQKEARAAGGDTKFVEKAFESISVVAKKFAVESADLITVIQKSGGAFEAAGGSLNELLALFTSVRATTRESADSIATGFRTIFARIQRVDTIQKLRDLGIELQTVEGKFVGPLEAVRRLSSALSNLDSRDFRFSLITEELGGIRQIGKIIPLIKQFSVAQKALAIASGSQGDLAKDAELAQTSLGNKLVKLREEFEALTRKLTQGDAFKVITDGAIAFSRALIKVVEAVEPLIPLLIAATGARFGKGIFGAARAFTGGGIRRNSGGPIPGVGNTDTVNAKLTPGEYVIRKSAAQRIGRQNLDKLNATGRVGSFSDGGPEDETEEQRKKRLKSGQELLRQEKADREAAAEFQRRSARTRRNTEEDRLIEELEAKGAFVPVRSKKEIADEIRADRSKKYDPGERRETFVPLERKKIVVGKRARTSLTQPESNVPTPNVVPGEIRPKRTKIQVPKYDPRDPNNRRSIANQFVDEEVASARSVKRQDPAQRAEVERLEKAANLKPVQDAKLKEISELQKKIASLPSKTSQSVVDNLERQLEIAQREAIDLNVNQLSEEDNRRLKDQKSAFKRPTMEKGSSGLLAARRNARAVVVPADPTALNAPIKERESKADAQKALSPRAPKTTTSSPIADISDFLATPKAQKNYKISEKEFDKMLGTSSNVVDEQKEAAKAAKEAAKIQKETAKKAAADARNQARVQKQAAEATKKYDKAVNNFAFGTSKKTPKSGAQFNSDFFDQFVTQPTATTPETTQNSDKEAKKKNKRTKPPKPPKKPPVVASGGEDNIDPIGVPNFVQTSSRSISPSTPINPTSSLTTVFDPSQRPDVLLPQNKSPLFIPPTPKLILPTDKQESGQIFVPPQSPKSSPEYSTESVGEAIPLSIKEQEKNKRKQKRAENKLRYEQRKAAKTTASNGPVISLTPDDISKKIENDIAAKEAKAAISRIEPELPKQDGETLRLFRQREKDRREQERLSGLENLRNNSSLKTRNRQGGASLPVDDFMSVDEIERLFKEFDDEVAKQVKVSGDTLAVPDLVGDKELQAVFNKAKKEQDKKLKSITTPNVGLAPAYSRPAQSVLGDIDNVGLMDGPYRPPVRPQPVPTQDFGGSQNIPGSGTGIDSGVVRELQAIKNAERSQKPNSLDPNIFDPLKLTTSFGKSIKDAIKSNIKGRREVDFNKELSKSAGISQFGQSMGFLGAIATATASQLGLLDKATADAVSQAAFFGTSILLIGSTITDSINNEIQKNIQRDIQKSVDQGVDPETIAEAGISSNNKALIRLSSVLNGFTVGLAAGGAVVSYFSAQTQNAADASTKLAEAQLERIRGGNGSVDIFATKTGEAAGLSDLSKRQQESGLVGAGSGALTGAIIGAFAGPFGLAAGAAIGGIIGGIGGGVAGVKLAGGENEVIVKSNKALGTSIGNTGTALNTLEKNLDSIGRTVFNPADQVENEIAANKATNAQFNILRTTLIAQVAAAKEAIRIESESGLVSDETKENFERLNKELDVATDRIKNNIDKTFLGVNTLAQKRLDGGSSLKNLLGSQEFKDQLGQLTQDLFDAGYTVQEVDAQLQNTIQTLSVDAITRAKLEILKIKEARAIDALVAASLDAATGLKTLEIAGNALSTLEQRFSNLGGTSSGKLGSDRKSELLGPISTNINNRIKQVDDVKAVLEPALNELRKLSISDKSINKEQLLNDTFNAAGLTVDKGIFDTIISSLDTAFKDGLLKTEGIADTLGDLDRLIEKDRNVKEQEIEVQQRYLDLSVNIQNALQESIQKRVDLEVGLVDILTKGQERLEDAFQKPLLSFANRQSAFIAQGTPSVGALSGNVSGLATRASQLQTGINFTRNLDRNQFDVAGVDSINKSAIQMEAELIRVTSELKRLSDQSGLAASALKDIDLERSKREAVQKPIKDFTFSDNAGRLDIARTFSALTRVLSTGDLQSIPDKLRGGVGQLLDQFKDVTLSGGLTGDDISKRLQAQTLDRAIRASGGRGISQDQAKQIFQSTSKEDQLVAQIKDINIQEYNAQLALIEIEKTQSAAILAQEAALVTQQQQIFTTLGQQIAISNQNQAIGQQAAANAGIAPVVGSIKSLETTIKTLEAELVGLNGNIAAYTKSIIGPTKTIEKDGKKIEVPLNDKGISTVKTIKQEVEDVIAAKNQEVQLYRDRNGGSGVLGFLKRTFFSGGIQRTGYATGGPVYRNMGGSMFKPQGTDTIPAMLSPGEYVVKKSAVDSIGVDALDRINTGYFASGGSIDDYLAGKLARRDANKQRKIGAAQAYRDRNSGIRNQRGVNAAKYRAYLRTKAAKNAIGPQGSPNYYAGGNKLAPSFIPYPSNQRTPQSNTPRTFGVSKFGTVITAAMQRQIMYNKFKKVHPTSKGLNISKVEDFTQPNVPTILPQSGFKPYQRKSPTPVTRRKYSPLSNDRGNFNFKPFTNRISTSDSELEKIRQKGQDNLRRFQNPRGFASGGVVGGRKSGGSGVDSVVKSFSTLVDKLENLGKIFNNMTMTHNVTVDGQLNLGGLNSKAIAEEIRDAIGKEVINIVKEMMDKNSKTLRAT